MDGIKKILQFILSSPFF